MKIQFGWPGTQRNNGSAAVGGLAYIPKLLDGRNKLFFFASVLDDAFAGAGSQTATVPTMQERTGDFSDLPVQTTNVPAAFTTACGTSTPYYGQYQLYDPFSATLDSNSLPPRSTVCGNVIPASRLANNANVQVYTSLMPGP